MKSSFLNSPSFSTSKSSSSAPLGPLGDPRFQLPSWGGVGRSSSSSSSVDGPTGHPNTTTTNAADGSTWSATTTTTTAGMQIPTKKQKKTKPPTPTNPSPAKMKAIPNPPKNTSTLLPPKSALQAWYGKRHDGIPSPNSCFTTWSDGGMPHVLKFTSMFTCPVTGERFCSGRYGDERNYTVVREKSSGVDVVWYSTKKLAEHGAAARALDCFALRENTVKFCLETPYMNPEDAPPLPHSCPENAIMFMDAMTEKKKQKLKEEIDYLEMKKKKDGDLIMEKKAGGMNSGVIGQMKDVKEEECEEEFDKLQNKYREMRETSGAGNAAADSVAATTTTMANNTATNITPGSTITGSFGSNAGKVAAGSAAVTTTMANNSATSNASGSAIIGSGASKTQESENAATITTVAIENTAPPATSLPTTIKTEI